jgi:hypothetical protein
MNASSIAITVGTLIALTSLPAPGADTVVIDRVPRITVQHVEVGPVTYPLLNGNSQDMRSSSPNTTQCWATYRTTCGTLAGIGYIDKARVTVRDGYAIRIEVLELRQ